MFVKICFWKYYVCTYRHTGKKINKSRSNNLFLNNNNKTFLVFSAITLFSCQYFLSVWKFHRSLKVLGTWHKWSLRVNTLWLCQLSARIFLNTKDLLRHIQNQNLIALLTGIVPVQLIGLFVRVYQASLACKEKHFHISMLENKLKYFFLIYFREVIC